MACPPTFIDLYLTTVVIKSYGQIYWKFTFLKYTIYIYIYIHTYTHTHTYKIWPFLPSSMMCLLLTPSVPKLYPVAPLIQAPRPPYTPICGSGTGLLLLEEQTWFQHQQMLTPAFHYDILKPYLGLMADSVQGMLVSSSLVSCTCSHPAQLAKSTLRYLCPSHINQTQPPRMIYSELNMR